MWEVVRGSPAAERQEEASLLYGIWGGELHAEALRSTTHMPAAGHATVSSVAELKVLRAALQVQNVGLQPGMWASGQADFGAHQHNVHTCSHR